MLQINNVGDGKSEWNINETHIIIPMINAGGLIGGVTSREALPGALAFNPFGVGEQTILTNTLEHSFVIGLNKNIFDIPNYRNDLVIIQNPELKLLPCNSELINPIAYALSYVDQDRNQILWQSSIPKDKFCMNSRGVLEVRDVLNYDDSTPELEKTKPQMNLENLNSNGVLQVSEANCEILRGSASEEKKEPHFINYYPEVQNNDPVPILPHLDTSKYSENIKSNDSIKSDNASLFKQDVSSGNKLLQNYKKSILNTTKPKLKFNKSVIVDCTRPKIKKKKGITESTFKDTGLEKIEENKNKETKNVLPEKSLPLKKKAKMKRTLSFGSDNQRSVLKQDSVSVNQGNIKIPPEGKLKKAVAMTNLKRKGGSRNSYSDEPIIKKQKKKSNVKSKKPQTSIVDSLGFANESKLKNQGNSLPKKEVTTKSNFFEFDINKFNNIFDVVDCLRKCRMINGPVWQTLNSGLKEMKVDILEEMNAKMNEKFVPERTEYSPQLKAFALVLYFKQPAAFNYLSQMYKVGWPSLTVIKKWKQQMNNHQQSNFVKTDIDVR